ncbi:hypothetical protein [Planctellipticum variicoloris]|uniref:hypothetical protein n=1 Tax=Planctellipticum variicoloris TaxID=3064265 RepID=UPI0030135694|nr:hypothetical protein SH412_003658 [Planctomycetaceae bacterium SH412]
MHAAFRDGIRSPGGMACEIGIAGGVLLWLFWWIGRDSGVGVFGGLVSILGLSVTAFTGRIVWELRVRHVRHVMLRDCLERLTKDVTLIRQAMESKSWTTARQAFGRIRGVLERLDLHVQVAGDVELLLSRLQVLQSLDNRSFPRMADDHLPDIERYRTIIQLMLVEFESGGSDG